MIRLLQKPASAGLLLCLLFETSGAVFASSVLLQAENPASQATQQKSARPEGSSTAQEKPAEKHSTPEDRQRLVAVAHKLEAAPLDPALASERQWAVVFAISAPDVHVRMCPMLLGDLRRPKYKYRSQISEQLLISSAAFLIEHPEQADNYRAQSIAGMEGVLKAYSAIIKADPQATAKSLDDLLEKQREGKLAETVSEVVKGCN